MEAKQQETVTAEVARYIASPDIDHVEVREMADGSRSWGVFATLIEDDDEVVWRSVVRRDGTLKGRERL